MATQQQYLEVEWNVLTARKRCARFGILRVLGLLRKHPKCSDVSASREEPLLLLLQCTLLADLSSRGGWYVVFNSFFPEAQKPTHLHARADLAGVCMHMNMPRECVLREPPNSSTSCRVASLLACSQNEIVHAAPLSRVPHVM